MQFSLSIMFSLFINVISSQGLLAAHRGGYMESQKEEGPAPLLWRFSDFLKWAELCPSEPEIGHALLRLVATCQGIPHACEVSVLSFRSSPMKNLFCKSWTY